jgi:hypothetical protein
VEEIHSQKHLNFQSESCPWPFGSVRFTTLSSDRVF